MQCARGLCRRVPELGLAAGRGGSRARQQPPFLGSIHWVCNDRRSELSAKVHLPPPPPLPFPDAAAAGGMACHGSSERAVILVSGPSLLLFPNPPAGTLGQAGVKQKLKKSARAHA